MKIQSTNEQICIYLKQKISNGDLVQGEQLNLNQIAEEFGVSVTPIRDAVNLLIHEGFIDKIGNKMFIHSIPKDERAMLEKAIVLQICTGYQLCLEMGLRDKLITDLEEVLKMQANINEGDLRTNTRAEITFDTTFVRCTGNKFLIRNLEKDFEYYDDLMYVAYHIHSENQRLKSEKEHAEFIQLIKEKRDEEFYDLMTKHYQDVIIAE